MKKLILLFVFGFTAIFLVNCSSSKKLAVPKTTYTTDVSAIVMTNCTPCHIPAKGGNKKPYDNYANLKTDIDEIVRRIELNPGDRGFMPFKHAKLSDSTIAVFKKWKSDGLLEK